MINLNILNNYKHCLLLKNNEYDPIYEKDFETFKNEYITNIYYPEFVHINSLCFDSFESSIIDTLNIKEHKENYQHIFVAKNLNDNLLSEIINNLNSKEIDKSNIVVIDNFNDIPFKAIEFTGEDYSLCFELLRGSALNALGDQEVLDEEKIHLIQNIEKNKNISEDIYKHSQVFIDTCEALSKAMNSETYYDPHKHYIFNLESIQERSILSDIFKHIYLYDKNHFTSKREYKNCKLYLDCPDFINEYSLIFPSDVAGRYSYHLFIGTENDIELCLNASSFAQVIGTCSLFYSKKDRQFLKNLDINKHYLKTNVSKELRISQIKN